MLAYVKKIFKPFIKLINYQMNKRNIFFSILGKTKKKCENFIWIISFLMNLSIYKAIPDFSIISLSAIFKDFD